MRNLTNVDRGAGSRDVVLGRVPLRIETLSWIAKCMKMLCVGEQEAKAPKLQRQFPEEGSGATATGLFPCLPCECCSHFRVNPIISKVTPDEDMGEDHNRVTQESEKLFDGILHKQTKRKDRNRRSCTVGDNTIPAYRE